MSAISFQLAAVLQETITDTPAQQAATNTTPVNPNQAQGAPAPQDTVTLTGQAPQGQQTQQNPQQPPFQETILFAAEAQVQVFAPGNNGAANTGAQQTPQAPATAQVQTSTQLQDPAAAAFATGNAGNPSGTGQTSEQELQQLDQTLQQLGINPQSISLFNRLALLLYANDPAALQQFVQQLQQGAQDVGEGTGATTLASQTQAQNPGQAQNQSAAFSQTGDLAQAATSGQTATQNQNQNQTQAAPQSSIFVQFEELQITFGAAGQPPSFSPNGVAPSNSNTNQNGPSLNVTA
jgi:hypothetical protein